MFCQLCKELKTRNSYYLVERVKGYYGGIQDNFIKVIKLDNKFYITSKGQGHRTRSTSKIKGVAK